MFELYGVAPAERPPQASYDFWRAHLHPDDRADVEAELRRCVERSGRFEVAFRIRRDDGEQRWIQAAAMVEDGADDRQVVGINRDITDEVQAQARSREINAMLEQRVQTRTTELRNVISELESFSYSVAHDLRAPLRGIDGFCRILLADYADKLDARGLDSLLRVRNAAQRLGQLIDDLLALSRISRAELNIVDVDLSALAAQVVAGLRELDPDRSVDVHIEPGLQARGDARLLRVALGNLLGNAWKFTSQTAAPRIEVGSQPLDGKTEFFVRDNGAGFDMRFVDKLFAPFQRLHLATEFPGSGVGLATVQRVLHKHGGTVRAHGAVGLGATFYFSLPQCPGEAQSRQDDPIPEAPDHE